VGHTGTMRLGRIGDQTCPPWFDGIVGLFRDRVGGAHRHDASRNDRRPNLPTMVLKVVFQRLKFGCASCNVIGTWVFTLTIQKGLRMAGMLLDAISIGEELENAEVAIELLELGMALPGPPRRIRGGLPMYL
jgi:hypothetical protein